MISAIEKRKGGGGGQGRAAIRVGRGRQGSPWAFPLSARQEHCRARGQQKIVIILRK